MGTNFKGLFTENIIPLIELKGKKIAIDGTNMLFQILFNPYQKQKILPNTFYLDKTNRVISHLYGWISKAKNLLNAGILPIIIFDGIPDIMKRDSHKDQARDYLAIKKKYEVALKSGNNLSARNYALGKSYMWINCLLESRKILQAAGIPVIFSPSEAEAQACYLQSNGFVDFVVTTDYDAILYGATKIIRHLAFAQRSFINGKWKSHKSEIKYIDVQSNLKRLNLSRNQLIELSILIGNDYFSGISQIGLKKGIASIQSYRNLEMMKLNHPKLFNSLSIDKIHEIRSIFISPIIKKLEIEKEIRIIPLNLAEIRHLCLEDHNLNKDRLEKRLKSLEKAYSKICKIFSKDSHILEYQRFDYQNKFLEKHLQRAKTKKGDEKWQKLEFIPAKSLKN